MSNLETIYREAYDRAGATGDKARMMDLTPPTSGSNSCWKSSSTSGMPWLPIRPAPGRRWKNWQPCADP